MKLTRILLAALSAVLLAAPAAAQTSYPDKPVRIIVGFTAGSATDVTARLFAQKLSEAWNVPVTVERRSSMRPSVRAASSMTSALPRAATRAPLPCRWRWP